METKPAIIQTPKVDLGPVMAIGLLKAQAVDIGVFEQPIDSQEMNLAVSVLQQTVKVNIKDIEAAYKDIIEAANKVHKTLTAKRKEDIAPYQELSDRLKARTDEYLTKLERERQAEERRQREEAARIAREERERQEEEQRVLAALAEKEAAEGNAEAAEELQKEAAAVVLPEPIIITPSVPKKVETAFGQGARKDYRYEIIDIDQIPREYMIPDEKKLKSLANAVKGESQPVPGVKFYWKLSTVTRSA